MTREEYLNLVRNSEAFKKMEPLLQQKILNADGALMEEYIKIFQEELTYLNAVQTDFMNKNAEIARNYTVDVKKLKGKTLKENEAKTTQEDQQMASNLLKQIK